MWNPKCDTSEFIYETETESQRADLWLLRGRGGGRGTEWEFGISKCKLLYIEWKNKVLLYSTGNCIEFPVINRNGKEYEKKVYVYITELLFSIAEINNIVKQPYFNFLKKPMVHTLISFLCCLVF